MSHHMSDERRRVLADRERARVRASAAADDVDLVTYADRWPVPGTRAERRARRRVLGWFAAAVVLTGVFVAVFLAWPWRYDPAPAGPGYEWFTPLAGLSLGGALLCLSFAIISYVKAFLPREVAVQQRHDDPAPLADQDDVAVILADAGTRSGLTRRSWFRRAAGADREVLEEGIETGIVVRRDHGGFVAVHQPLGPVDQHGDRPELRYAGTPVPKRLNDLGLSGTPVPGGLFRPDPPGETAALRENDHDHRQQDGGPR